MAQQAEHLLKLDNETLGALLEKLKSVYGGVEGGKHDEIIASLVDVIDDILKIRQKKAQNGQGTM